MKAKGKRNTVDKYESEEDKYKFEYLKIIKNVYTKESKRKTSL